jgi:hypothetical protein
MVVEALPQGKRLRRLFDGLRAKLNDMLDDSRVYRRRSDDVDSRSGSGGGGGINVPASAVVGFVMYLIAQTGGIIWWAATMQARVDHAEGDRAREEQRLWDSINNYHLEVNALRLDLARIQDARATPGRSDRYKGD